MNTRTMMIVMLATGALLGLSARELYIALREMSDELAFRRQARGLICEARTLTEWAAPHE